MLGVKLLRDEHMHAFTRAIVDGELDSVETINLGRNLSITDAAVKMLAAALADHPLPSLKWLYLHGNLITDEGMAVLADCL